MSTFKRNSGAVLAVMLTSACSDSPLRPSPTSTAPTLTQAPVFALEGQTYSVGGTVAGLVGSSLVLSYSGSNGGTASITLSANGAFAFTGSATGAVTGTGYNVTVGAQPTDPVQICGVDGGSGSGTVESADVTNISVSCGSIPAPPPGTPLPPGTPPSTTSTNCMIPIVGFSGDYQISDNPSASYRIATTGSPGAPLETTTLTASGLTVVSESPYQVVPMPNGGARLAWNSTRTEVIGPGVHMVINQATAQALRLPMQPGEVQSISGAISGTVSIEAPGLSCTAPLTGSQQASFGFVGVEPVSVPAGTFTACRFSYDRTADTHTVCNPGFAAGAATDHLSIWTVDGLGVVKTLDTVKGSITELLTRPVIPTLPLFKRPR